jgi:hypothetical protein
MPPLYITPFYFIYFVTKRVDIDGYKLAGFGVEYFNILEEGPSMDDKSFLQGYKSVLTSKDTEEAMVGIQLSSSLLEYKLNN